VLLYFVWVLEEDEPRCTSILKSDLGLKGFWGFPTIHNATLNRVLSNEQTNYAKENLSLYPCFWIHNRCTSVAIRTCTGRCNRMKHVATHPHCRCLFVTERTNERAPATQMKLLRPELKLLRKMEDNLEEGYCMFYSPLMYCIVCTSFPVWVSKSIPAGQTPGTQKHFTDSSDMSVTVPSTAALDMDLSTRLSTWIRRGAG